MLLLLSGNNKQPKKNQTLTDPVRGAVADVHLPVKLSPRHHNVSADFGHRRNKPGVRGRGSPHLVHRRALTFVDDGEVGAGEMQGRRKGRRIQAETQAWDGSQHEKYSNAAITLLNKE